MPRLAPLAEAVHSFTLSQQSYESFFILMSFSGNWVFQMHMVNSLIDAALRVPLVNAPWVPWNRWIIMWVGDCTVAEQLCMPHRKCRLKSKAQPPGNRPIRIGNDTSQWHQNYRDSKHLVLGLENTYILFNANKGKEGFGSTYTQNTTAFWSFIFKSVIFYLQLLLGVMLYWICIITVQLPLNPLDEMTSWWPSRA